MKVHEIFAYICVKDAEKAIAFYKDVFNVKEKFRLTDKSGRIGHAELEMGTGTLMLSDEFPEWNSVAPNPKAPRSFQLHAHVDNADEVFARAIERGAEVVSPMRDQFYGERSGNFRDPFGHTWNVGHQIAEMSPEDMQRRYEEWEKQQ